MSERMFPIPMKVLEELAVLRSKQREAYREKRERLRKQQQERANHSPAEGEVSV